MERSFVTVIEPTFISHRSFHDPAVTRSHSWWAISAVTPSALGHFLGHLDVEPLPLAGLLVVPGLRLVLLVRRDPDDTLRLDAREQVLLRGRTLRRGAGGAGASPGGLGLIAACGRHEGEDREQQCERTKLEVAHHASFRGEPERAPLPSVGTI